MDPRGDGPEEGLARLWGTLSPHRGREYPGFGTGNEMTRPSGAAASGAQLVTAREVSPLLQPATIPVPSATKVEWLRLIPASHPNGCSSPPNLPAADHRPPRRVTR